MSRTADINIVSFNDAEFDNGQRYALTDIGTDREPHTFSDALKFSSGVDGVMVAVHGTVAGGREDCVDMNCADNCTVHALRWVPRGRYLATIKGGSSGWYLSGNVAAHGSETDVDLGNWSDQSRSITGSGTLDLRSLTGRPIRVRVLHAQMPVMLPGTGPYRYSFPWPWLGPVRRWLVAAWRLGRRLAG